LGVRSKATKEIAVALLGQERSPQPPGKKHSSGFDLALIAVTKISKKKKKAFVLLLSSHPPPHESIHLNTNKNHVTPYLIHRKLWDKTIMENQGVSWPLRLLIRLCVTTVTQLG